jgi:Flp pilus assembly protein TadB
MKSSLRKRSQARSQLSSRRPSASARRRGDRGRGRRHASHGARTRGRRESKRRHVLIAGAAALVLGLLIGLDVLTGAFRSPAAAAPSVSAQVI